MPVSRSPNYPAISLPEAVELITKLYQREKRSPAGPEHVALALGYRSMSGPARTKLSALRKFGLVEDTGNGVRISDLGMTILYPQSADEKSAALREAATTPALFRELAGYPGASDENLVSRLVRMGFTEAGARAAVASFRKTTSLAPTEASRYDSDDDEPENVLTSPAFEIPMTRTSPSHAGTAISVELPSGGRMDLRVSGRVTLEDLGVVEAYLDLVKKTALAPEAEAVTDLSPSFAPVPTEQQPLSEQSPGDAQG